MIGNDIVDLKRSPFIWKRPRFLEKVFTQQEQVLIHNCEHQHQMAWLLWSMKEAAYKCYVQQSKERFFNPKRLVCERVSKDKGIVKIDNQCYYTASIITEDYVYTTANLSRKGIVNSSVFKTKSTSYSIQSQLLKQRFLKSVSESRSIASDALKIEKTEKGVPQLFFNSEKLSMAFSLTHCGAYSAFVIF